MVTSIPSLIVVFILGALALLLFLRNNPKWAIRLGIKIPPPAPPGGAS